MKKKDFTIYIFFKIYSKKFNKINFKNNKTKMILIYIIYFCQKNKNKKNLIIIKQ